ncbi:hypothetical protein [Vibrio sp. D431a]|uniref:hypothetical protein n=1 Tax=Vibrio sp. D431a TaxID=2837388 RepID=UPI00255742C2|nr:hypothetical protein [Vibrio sp. D431a]MDK9793746.1 hypothetical protein [Vibrio sp. D431a]
MCNLKPVPFKGMLYVVKRLEGKIQHNKDGDVIKNEDGSAKLLDEREVYFTRTSGAGAIKHWDEDVSLAHVFTEFDDAIALVGEVYTKDNPVTILKLSAASS